MISLVSYMTHYHCAVQGLGKIFYSDGRGFSECIITRFRELQDCLSPFTQCTLFPFNFSHLCTWKVIVCHARLLGWLH